MVGVHSSAPTTFCALLILASGAIFGLRSDSKFSLQLMLHLAHRAYLRFTLSISSWV